MDGSRFDGLAKFIATPRSRRQLLRAASAGLAGALGIAVGRAPAAAFICRAGGMLCGTDAHCCSGVCDTQTHQCTCLAGTILCRDRCIPACTALDQCHLAGACDPSTGQCTNPAKDDGTACDDGNACTQTDTCQSGVCTGSDPVVCTALDQCHDVGTCDPATGLCSNPAKTDGSLCGNGHACCRGVCTDITTTTNCGSCGDVCTPPANTVAACDSGACAYSCVSDFHNCGGACVSDGDTAHCGTSCTDCTTGQPANTTAACQDGKCVYTCDVSCGTKCCAAGQVCTDSTAGTCCTPNDACAGRNCGAVTNSCGQQVSCGTCTETLGCCKAGQCEFVICGEGTLDPATCACVVPCAALHGSCTQDSDCCSPNVCKSGFNTCCTPLRAACASSNDCCGSGVCTGGVCSTPCTGGGGCSVDSDCCSNVCCQVFSPGGHIAICCGPGQKCYPAGICA